MWLRHLCLHERDRALVYGDPSSCDNSQSFQVCIVVQNYGPEVLVEVFAHDVRLACESNPQGLRL